MEKLTYKYQALKKSQQTFERALNLYKNPPSSASQAESEAYTASVIKHFELLYEVLWKFLKFYLMEKYGTQVAGSKTIFRACESQGLINAKERDQLLEIVEIRNITAHVYDEKNALQISSAIANHYPVIKKIIESIKI